METVNIHKAKTHLSRLVDQAAKGRSFVIAKAGKPMVVVTAWHPKPKKMQRIGFLKGSGEVSIPDDFDRMGEAEIQQLFVQE